MAVYIDVSTIGKKVVEYPNVIIRQNPLPLEKTSLFNSTEAASSYAATDNTAYFGQIISVAEPDGSVMQYIIGKNSEGNGDIYPYDRKKWDDAYDKIPTEAWVYGNELADKQYVRDKIESDTANFRGNWTTWSSVPTASAEYPSDVYGNTMPTRNDYMVVQNASDSAPYTATVDIGIIGKTLAVKVLDFEAGHIFTEEDIKTLTDNGITKVSLKRSGSWKYKYNGEWEEGINGKNKWEAEYLINGTPFNTSQWSAINSGITSSLVSQIGTNETNIETLTTSAGEWNNMYERFQSSYENWDTTYNTVKATSGDWNSYGEALSAKADAVVTKEAYDEITGYNAKCYNGSQLLYTLQGKNVSTTYCDITVNGSVRSWEYVSSYGFWNLLDGINTLQLYFEDGHPSKVIVNSGGYSNTTYFSEIKVHHDVEYDHTTAQKAAALTDDNADHVKLVGIATNATKATITKEKVTDDGGSISVTDKDGNTLSLSVPNVVTSLDAKNAAKVPTVAAVNAGLETKADCTFTTTVESWTLDWDDTDKLGHCQVTIPKDAPSETQVIGTAENGYYVQFHCSGNNTGGIGYGIIGEIDMSYSGITIDVANNTITFNYPSRVKNVVTTANLNKTYDPSQAADSAKFNGQTEAELLGLTDGEPTNANVSILFSGSNTQFTSSVDERIDDTVIGKRDTEADMVFEKGDNQSTKVFIFTVGYPEAHDMGNITALTIHTMDDVDPVDTTNEYKMLVWDIDEIENTHEQIAVSTNSVIFSKDSDITWKFSGFSVDEGHSIAFHIISASLTDTEIESITWFPQQAYRYCVMPVAYSKISTGENGSTRGFCINDYATSILGYTASMRITHDIDVSEYMSMIENRVNGKQSALTESQLDTLNSDVKSVYRMASRSDYEFDGRNYSDATGNSHAWGAIFNPSGIGYDTDKSYSRFEFSIKVGSSFNSDSYRGTAWCRLIQHDTSTATDTVIAKSIDSVTIDDSSLNTYVTWTFEEVPELSEDGLYGFLFYSTYDTESAIGNKFRISDHKLTSEDTIDIWSGNNTTSWSVKPTVLDGTTGTYGYVPVTKLRYLGTYHKPSDGIPISDVAFTVPKIDRTTASSQGIVRLYEESSDTEYAEVMTKSKVGINWENKTESVSPFAFNANTFNQLPRLASGQNVSFVLPVPDGNKCIDVYVYMDLSEIETSGTVPTISESVTTGNKAKFRKCNEDELSCGNEYMISYKIVPTADSNTFIVIRNISRLLQTSIFYTDENGNVVVDSDYVKDDGTVEYSGDVLDDGTIEIDVD